MIRKGYLPSNFGPASVLGFLFGLVVFISIANLLWDSTWPFFSMSHFPQHLAGWFVFRVHSVIPEFFPGAARQYAFYLSQLPPDVPAWKLTGRFDVAACVALLVCGVTAWLIGKAQPDTKIVAGRTLFEGKAAHRQLKKTAKRECANSGEGIKLHPSFEWSISRDRETRHFFILGSVGGGKTQIILPLALAAIARGDKVIIYDSKGDFTSKLDVPFVLLAPWDARSSAWDIASDCDNVQDARELAARLIAEGNDPMWHQAARQVLTAIIVKLQTEKPRAWTWRDLHTLACSSQNELLAIVKQHQPEARHLLEAEGKTTQGILINFAASMSVVGDLAAAWGAHPPEKRFSFSNWAHAKNPQTRVVVLQGSGRYEELTRGYVQSVISLLAGRINSPEFGESKIRRLWLFLDEFPQLRKLERFGSILEVGRSKGVCVVLGAQDMAQIQEIYGQYTGKAWGSMVGTQIVVRVNAGETAQWIAKELVGYATIEKTVMHEGKKQPPQKHEQLVMEAADISDHLGVDDEGVRALIVGMNNAHIVAWPYSKLKNLREASIDAEWLVSPAATQISTTTQFAQPPRIKLRQPTAAELWDMADSGSDLTSAGEPLHEMEETAGGEK